jgi:NADH oxidase (H2O-forming)
MLGPIEIKPGLYWIGSEDPDLRVFDDLFPTEHGTSYNAYLLKGTDKTVLIDTVEEKFVDEYMDKVKLLIDPKTIDYIIVNHTEHDHSGSLAYLLEQAPQAQIYCTTAAKNFLGNILPRPVNCHTVKDGDTLDLGGRTLRFILAPFLHWPDTMFTRLEEDNVLFSCDAFAAHYWQTGHTFNDEVDDFTSARHFYFDCIFRPFKGNVLLAVEKIRHDVIDIICPSHGPIIRRDPWKVIQQFETWSKPASQGKKIIILYLSPHGSTEKMAHAVAAGASHDGIEVASYHINNLNAGELRNLMEEADALLFGVPTFNRDIAKPMWEVLAYLSTVTLKTNLAGIFGSYGWSGEACKMAEDRLKSLGFKMVGDTVRTLFSPKPEVLEQCEALGRAAAEAVAVG